MATTPLPNRMIRDRLVTLLEEWEAHTRVCMKCASFDDAGVPGESPCFIGKDIISSMVKVLNSFIN